MGGKVFKDLTRSILREEIEPTLEWLEDRWPNYYRNGGHLCDHLLGSAGKKPLSGDLDLNIKEQAYDKDELLNELKDLFGDEHVRAMQKGKVIFTAIPIMGDPSNGYVQMDFMIGDHKWQEFSFYSSPNSPYKGLYRTELIKALVAYNSDWTAMENGELVARIGPTFFHHEGCVWRCRMRRQSKRGSGRIKAFDEVPFATIQSEWPDAVPPSHDVIKDPQRVVNIILPEKFTVEDVESIEKLVESVVQSYNQTSVEEITSIFVERLNSLKVNIPVDDLTDMGLRFNQCAGMKS